MSLMWEQALTGSSVDLNFGFIMANCNGREIGTNLPRQRDIQGPPEVREGQTDCHYDIDILVCSQSQASVFREN